MMKMHCILGKFSASSVVPRREAFVAAPALIPFETVTRGRLSHRDLFYCDSIKELQSFLDAGNFVRGRVSSPEHRR